MKQILQNLGTGEITVANIPTPRTDAGQVLIRTSVSLISAGTERMLVAFGKANWIDKIRQQPDKVKMVLEKTRTDGVMATLDAVRSKLDQPVALGYCNVGRVISVGDGVGGVLPGDRIASNGKHAELVSVPKNLCAKIPDNVSDEAASFTVIGAIGLQGIRLADPKLGECVAVIGLGLIGLMTVQMLKAQGCRVIGLDFDETRLRLAREFGAETINLATGEDLLDRVAAFSRGVGLDAVLITASTSSNEPVSQAAKMCRKRGRIVLVGVTGLELNRAEFYEKELSFQVSCSYGPGRYDPAYEEGGHDYPVGFVRWTEQRNFEAVLDLMAAGAIDVTPLITHRYPLEQAQQAFEMLTSGQPSLGLLIDYPQAEDAQALGSAVSLNVAAPPSRGSVGFLGAGNYAGRALIPAFRASKAHLRSVVSSGGVSAVHYGQKNGFVEASTDAASVFADAQIDTVVIATRHDLHAAQVIGALQAGKHVFCEKPLCLTLDELASIEAIAAERPDKHIMVGFNRRFAPQTVKMKSLLDSLSLPKAFIMTVNAGDIPPDHWTQDPAVGGGRVIGEACHYIDLIRHLAGSSIIGFKVETLGQHPAVAVRSDKVSICLTFADGSMGTIHYLANGHKGYPKERLEVFAAGRVLQLDNFRKLKGWGWKGFSKLNLLSQDKGTNACVNKFMEAVIGGGPTPIDRSELFEVTRASIEIAKVAQ